MHNTTMAVHILQNESQRYEQAHVEKSKQNRQLIYTKPVCYKLPKYDCTPLNDKSQCIFAYSCENTY